MRKSPAVILRTATMLILMTAFVVSAQNADTEAADSPGTLEVQAVPLEAPPATTPPASPDPQEPSPASAPETAVPAYFQRFVDASAGEADADAAVTNADDTPIPSPMDSLQKLALKAVITLCLLCAVFILAAYFFRKFATNSPILAGPRLGKVLGKVYLNPKTSLHYVQSGSRVLVIGVTRQQLCLITEFDAAEFELPEETEEQAAPKEMPFVNALDAALQESQHDEDDIKTLRGDIERLREHLRDTVREHTD